MIDGPICPCCGKKALISRWQTRTRRVGGRWGISLPPDTHIFICPRTTEPVETDELKNALRLARRVNLRDSAARSLDELSRWCSGRKLEIALGLSQGYLSRLRHQRSQPSLSLVILLDFLATKEGLLSDLLSPTTGGGLDGSSSTD